MNKIENSSPIITGNCTLWNKLFEPKCLLIVYKTIGQKIIRILFIIIENVSLWKVHKVLTKTKIINSVLITIILLLAAGFLGYAGIRYFFLQNTDSTLKSSQDQENTTFATNIDTTPFDDSSNQTIYIFDPENYHGTNVGGTTVFRILDPNQLEVFNIFRQSSNSSLRLSILGAEVVEIKLKSPAQLWTFKLSDNSTIQFNYQKTSQNISTFTFNWLGGGPNDQREVCFHYGHRNATWFSTYQSFDQEWPMNKQKESGKRPFNAISAHDPGTDPGEFFFVLEHLFLNTDGFSVILDEHQPLFMQRSFNAGDPVMCFSVDNAYPYSTADHDSSYKDIKFSIFSGQNIRSVAKYSVHDSGFIPKPRSTPNASIFTYPSHIYGHQHEPNLFGYIDKLKQHGMSRGQIINNGQWDSVGNHTTWITGSVVNQAHSRGFNLCVELYPRYESAHKSSTGKYYLKSNDGTPTNMLDFTRADTTDWYLALVKKLSFELDIHCFMTVFFGLQNYQKFNGKYPNLYQQNFLRTVAKVGHVNSWFAFKMQDLPMLTVILPNHFRINRNSFLDKLIHGALAISMAGYSSFTAEPIGKEIPPGESSEEIFIRWLQIATFMPSMSFYYHHQHNVYFWDTTNKTIAMTKQFVALHIKHAPVIVELAKNRVATGNPIIRPMWYAEPEDPRAFQISDQFMLGDDIVVAPVVVVGERARNVYLPSGSWVDQHGQNFTGPGEFMIEAPLEELPFFKRKLN